MKARPTIEERFVSAMQAALARLEEVRGSSQSLAVEVRGVAPLPAQSRAVEVRDVAPPPAQPHAVEVRDVAPLPDQSRAVEVRGVAPLPAQSRAVEVRGVTPRTFRIGLAVSGGSDSMSMMHLAARHAGELSLEPVVLCFDHAIAGENSAAEAAFVLDAAKRLGLEAFARRATPPVMAGRGLSLEMAARNARRAFFADAARELDLDAIATAHQRDDAAELLLMRLLRGAGASGLSGLRPFSPPYPPHPAIVRPLLGCGREELRAWLRRRRIRWMEDVANGNLDIPRCRVRLRLIPEMARIMGKPGEEVIAALAQSATILRDEDDFLESLVSSAQSREVEVRGVPPHSVQSHEVEERGVPPRTHPALARRIARSWLLREVGEKAVSFDAIERLLAAEPSSVVNLPGGAVVEIDSSQQARLRAPVTDPEVPLPAAIPLRKAVVWGKYSISARRVATVSKSRRPPGEWPASCTLSADAIAARGPLSVRARREHDRMTPFGINGSKSLQDIFVDAKIPSGARATWPVICVGDEIAWIPGYRIAAQFAVKPGGRAVKITVKEVEP